MVHYMLAVRVLEKFISLCKFVVVRPHKLMLFARIHTFFAVCCEAFVRTRVRQTFFETSLIEFEKKKGRCAARFTQNSFMQKDKHTALVAQQFIFPFPLKCIMIFLLAKTIN